MANNYMRQFLHFVIFDDENVRAKLITHAAIVRSILYIHIKNNSFVGIVPMQWFYRDVVTNSIESKYINNYNKISILIKK